ncbi:MAG: ATP-binding protein [Candidatus Scalindua sp.]
MLRTIKSKLILFTLCISLIPISVIVSVYYFSARKVLKQQINEKMIAIAESKKLHVDTFLKAIESRAVDFSSDGFIRSNLGTINREGFLKKLSVINLNKHLKNNKQPLDPDITGITILNKFGMVAASTVKSAVGEDFSGHEEYIHIIGKNVNEAFTHRPHFSEYLSSNAIEVAAPITSMESEEIIGIIINAYTYDVFNKITSNRKGMGDSGEIVLGIRDKDKIRFLNSLRYAPEVAVSLKVPLDVKTAIPMRLALEGRYGTIIAPDYRGTMVIAAYQHIPAMDWGLVAKMDRAEAFASLKLLRNIAIISDGICSAVVIGVGIVFSISTARPINRLKQASERIADGNLEHRVEINRNDEIGALAVSFNDMTRKLAHEITEHKRAEDELTVTNKELEAFCYSVSHDLRAPLRGIDGFSKILEDDYTHKLDEQGMGYIKRIRAASQRMGQLISDLLNLSRITRSEMKCEKVDLSAMVKRKASRLQKTQPDHHVEFIIAEGIYVNGDEGLLRVAVNNLLGNAWKFTEKHSQARIEFGITKNDSEHVYFVRDDGAGFDMAYVDKLFGAFQRLHSLSEFDGTGIGLATVQRIIHRHGGRIWAEGAVEQGATFYFTV